MMVTAIVFPILTKIGIIIDFKINQDYISEVFCINRDEPIIMCSGKCYLTEKLKKAENHEEKQAPKGKKEKVEIGYCLMKKPIDLSSFKVGYITKLKPGFDENFYHSSFITDVFHPPKQSLI